MKCLNPLKIFSNCLVNRVGQNVYLNQSCRKFDEMPKSTKYLFHCPGQVGESRLGGRGCQTVHLNQSCRKFDEMHLIHLKYFVTVWSMGWVKMCT